ncbi:MAG: transglycosylase SLT domain-containing protein [Synergistes sp.]|nr:transglycosylase SLT domain-containing protein [Synergistes sp.]
MKEIKTNSVLRQIIALFIFALLQSAFADTSCLSAFAAESKPENGQTAVNDETEPVIHYGFDGMNEDDEENEEEESPNEVASEKKTTKNAVSYHKAIVTLLRKHGLSEAHISKWAAENPHSTLNKISSLSPAKQKKIADVASYIKKTSPKLTAKTVWREASAIVYYSEKYKIPVDLVVGVAKLESRFNPSAQGSGGALGVMQVVWKVHHGMLSAKSIAHKKEHMFDPERGVEAGVLVISRYVKAYGTIQKALRHYCGKSSMNYLKKVMENMEHSQKHAEARQ